MVRVADYIAEFIYKLGIKDVFMFVGGGMMFLADGIAKHPELQAISTHHEQAAAMAGISYAKYNEKIGVILITTGCGGTNSITGLLDAWQDNVPCLFISGQSKRSETIQNAKAKLRQFGVQEADIISIVDSITKYAIMINDPNQIAYHLEKSVYLAKSGRPGPVWLDVPLDVQAALVDEKLLTHFHVKEIENEYKTNPTINEKRHVIESLSRAERPIVIAGQGIRLAKAIEDFKYFIEKHKIPFVVSRLGIDLLPSDHPLSIGRIGNKGDRAGNFAVQNADLIIAVGSRLSVSSTGHEYHNFGRAAKIIVVDIDPEEHKKNTVRVDYFINSDAKYFFKCFKNNEFSFDQRWLEICQKWKHEWPVCLPEYKKEKDRINSYYFIDCLSKKMKEDSVIVSDAGSVFYVVSQGIKLKKNQRYITSGAQAEMGYTIPACIGISVANRNGEVLGMTGDGSFQLNLQELETIRFHNFPIKLFVWNNDGYLAIRITQSKFFDGRFMGTDKTCGISFPSIKKIANAYGIKYFQLKSSESLEKDLDEVLNYPKATICEVNCIRDQEIIPVVSSSRNPDGTMVSKPLEDMYPFLNRDEFRRNMIVKPIDE